MDIILKKTMVKDAEKKTPVWSKKNDTRITGFGKFLRVTNLDEIPQLVNILVGDMSFIAPTILDYLGLKIPGFMKGKSLLRK
ncbi:sugar transferase [Bacteroidota bacterium]